MDMDIIYAMIFFVVIGIVSVALVGFFGARFVAKDMQKKLESAREQSRKDLEEIREKLECK